MKQWLTWAWMVGLAVILASAAWGQTPGTGANPPRITLEAVGSTLLFGFIGIVLAIVGFKLFDMATPFSLESEICERQNLAVAIVSGSMILGICIIVAVAVL